PFHEEEIPCCAIRITLHHHWALLNVWEQYWRDVHVILKEVSFCDSQLGPEWLVEVCELNDAAGHINLKAVLVLWELYRRYPLQGRHLTASHFRGVEFACRKELPRHLVKV